MALRSTEILELGAFLGPSSFDSRTFGRKGTGRHWGGCTKDMRQLEQTLARLEADPKEYEKKKCILSTLFKSI